MVLDDDLDIATIVKMTLQSYGFNNVSLFTEPSKAIMELRENGNNYSMVISDIRMPGMDGFEFADHINRVNPDIKLILMTAFDINRDLLTMNSYKPRNVTQIIQKPISARKLAKIVSAL
jgi:DNA-binding NtrC family response regulator